MLANALIDWPIVITVAASDGSDEQLFDETTTGKGEATGKGDMMKSFEVCRRERWYGRGRIANTLRADGRRQTAGRRQRAE